MNRRGFTIMEVLVALVILGMMAMGLASAYLNILNSYERVKTRPALDLDLRFARNALLAEADFETAQKGDEFEGVSGRQVTWSAIIEPTQTANLFLVTFTCVLGPGNDAKEEENTVIETFRLLRPTWSVSSGFTPDAATLRAEARDIILQNQQPSPLSGIGGSGGGLSGSSGGGGNTSSRATTPSTKSGSGGSTTRSGGGATKR